MKSVVQSQSSEAGLKAKSRSASLSRKTKETEISISVDLDNAGEVNIKTSLPFLSHMLEALAVHGRFSLTVDAVGDIEVDPHHLIEDTGIVLGETIFKALGGFKGIERAGCFTYPMDGSLVLVAIDICGRRNLSWKLQFGNFTVGNLDPNLFREFYKGFVDGLRSTLHIKMLESDNDHHVIEASFKALARALRQAITPLAGNEYLSTKGVLDEN
ncbi:MAG: imidazoleglycerol-phosphate dehydratase HisB [Candidatus Obscuribacterales bacterium]|nr:imidazoleglycerol-phosphate dehydratase HisB [Candidatus Obscuribacterales bacterium]